MRAVSHFPNHPVPTGGRALQPKPCPTPQRLCFHISIAETPTTTDLIHASVHAHKDGQSLFEHPGSGLFSDAVQVSIPWTTADVKDNTNISPLDVSSF